MLKGTRVLIGQEAITLSFIIHELERMACEAGYAPVFIPSIWEQAPFVSKAGPEILNQMYTFKDKGDRDVCLIPEVTAIIQQMYKDHWSKSQPKPMRIFYVSRCYRYERPQAGRYREFWQFGIEHLGNSPAADTPEVQQLLLQMLRRLGVDFEFNDSVKRGLDYYVEDGFEASCPKLGAQKQIAGGGRYDCGIGFAIGVDRLMLALEKP